MTKQNLAEQSHKGLASLKGRVAVVTGGAQGIGLAIAKCLMEAGAEIIITDKDVDNAMDGVLDELNENGRKALGYNYEARSVEDMQNAAEHALDQFGRLDIWVNDAGIYPSSSAIEITGEEWVDMIDTNRSGVSNGMNAAISHMKESGGVILNICSVAKAGGTGGFAQYSSTKFVVKPGAGETAEGDSIQSGGEEKPLGRITRPEEIERVAIQLAGNIAASFTGTAPVADGKKAHG